MEVSFFISLYILLMIKIVSSATIQWPVLNWGTTDSSKWFEHSGTNPVTYIRMQSWGSGSRCNIKSGTYAWVNSNLQQYTSGTNSQSQVYNKKTSAQCIDSSAAINGYLNNGRKWLEDSECYTFNCNSNTWTGRAIGEPCASHIDCNQKLAWRRSYIWPFESTWQSWASSGSYCITDYDWSPNHFCWYQTASDVSSGLTKWMQKFSAENLVTFGWKSLYSDSLKDAIQNGIFWKNGLAYNSATNTATWFQISKVTNQNNVVLTSPYSCQVNDTATKCRYYADSTNYIESNWEWDLGTSSTGYCPIPGPTHMAEYGIYMSYVNGNSTCHTLDRDNYNAQLEWGIGPGDDWYSAANSKFNFTYYPFVQNSTVGIESITL